MKVILYGNICINEDFDDNTKIATVAQALTNKCGYDESSTNTSLTMSSNTFKSESQSCEEKFRTYELFMNKTIQKKKLCETEKLESTHNVTFAAKLEELQNVVEQQTREIQELSIMLQKKVAEINEKDLRIRNLEKYMNAIAGNSQW